MSHKLDKARHRRTVRNRMRRLKQRYLAITQNDSVEPDKALATLKGQDRVELAKRLARQLAARGVHVRLAASR
jgi:hypothetical protein